MHQPDTLRDLEILVRSRHGLIAIDTAEPDRASVLLRHLADRLGVPLFGWSPTRALRKLFDPAGQDASGAIYDSGDLDKALVHAETSGMDGIYHFHGVAGRLEDEPLIYRMKDAAAAFKERKGAVVLTGDAIELPPTLRRWSGTVTLPTPSPDEFRELVRQIYRDLSGTREIRFELTRPELDQLIEALRGLTWLEAEKVLTRVMIEDDALTAGDLRRVAETKAEIVQREGLLEYYPAEQALDDVAGLAGLKEWLGRRKRMFENRARAREFGLEFPKGILLIGVPGCGKSLCAKAVATEWSLPLLKFDPSALYNRYVGETEKNFRRATRAAERMAPVVLWIDEIEKAFAASGNDGGVSTRVLGSFLSWLQDRSGDVFVVATANDVSSLPPELLRKGRFDEIFFVDLPGPAAREEIFRIHLARRDHDSGRFDLPALAEEAAGFSGAEIEQAVVSALYTAFANEAPLTETVLAEEIRVTRPLSETMHERIADLREWAAERTVSADRTPPPESTEV